MILKIRTSVKIYTESQKQDEITLPSVDQFSGIYHSQILTEIMYSVP